MSLSSQTKELNIVMVYGRHQRRLSRAEELTVVGVRKTRMGQEGIIVGDYGEGLGAVQVILVWERPGEGDSRDGEGYGEWRGRLQIVTM